jgi:hypothetical protein
MVRYGYVYINGTKINGTSYVLAAFGPGGDKDCRAVNDIAANDIHEDGFFYYLTVCGNLEKDGEVISFKVYDSSSDQIYDIYIEDKDKEKAIFHDDSSPEDENLDLYVCFTHENADSSGSGGGCFTSFISITSSPLKIFPLWKSLAQWISSINQ